MFFFFSVFSCMSKIFKSVTWCSRDDSRLSQMAK